MSQGAHAFEAPRKKLIEAGWERPDASDLLKHQKAIEKTPYDGIVLMLNGRNDAGKAVSLQTSVFDPRPLKQDWFAEDIRQLKSFRSQKLTDNFVRVSVSRNAPDWFDDAAWAQIVEHWKTAATIAREGKLKGILFDPEMYSGATLFSYGLHPRKTPHSFDETCAKVRQRGRETIAAIARIYPEMVFFTFRMNDINRKYASNIQAGRYNLYPAYINGWLDAAPPQMRFVDGGESAYTYSRPEQFLETANWIRNEGLILVAPENRAKYRAQVQAGFGLYLDAYSYHKPDSRYYLGPLDGSRLNRLQSNVQAAMRAADEYVWTWGEHYRWWPTNTKNVLPQSWEEALPGTTAVLLNATHPERARAAAEARFAALVAQNKLPNLLANSDFADAAANTAAPQDDWTNRDMPAGWSSWQKQIKDRPDGVFQRVTSGNSSAMQLSGLFEGFLIQEVPVQPGETYFIRTRARQQGSGLVRLDVRWKNAQNKWSATNANQTVTFDSAPQNGDPQRGDPQRGEPGTLYTTAIVPAGAAKLVVLAGASGQGSAQDKAWFDSVEVYRLPAK